MREIVHIQAGQCGNQIGAKVRILVNIFICFLGLFNEMIKADYRIFCFSDILYCKLLSAFALF